MPCHRPLSIAPAGPAAFAAPGVAVPRVATRTAEPACPVRGGRDFSQRGKLRAGHIVEQPREPLLSGQVVPGMHLLSLPPCGDGRGTAQGRHVPSAPGADCRMDGDAGVISHSLGVSPSNRDPEAAVDACGRRGGEAVPAERLDAGGWLFLSTAALSAQCMAQGQDASLEGSAAAVLIFSLRREWGAGRSRDGRSILSLRASRAASCLLTPPGRAPSDSPEQAIPFSPRAKARCRGARPGSSLQVSR